MALSLEVLSYRERRRKRRMQLQEGFGPRGSLLYGEGKKEHHVKSAAARRLVFKVPPPMVGRGENNRRKVGIL